MLQEFPGLVYGEPRGGLHRLDYSDPAGRERTLQAAPVSLADRQALRTARQGPRGARDALWAFEVRHGTLVRGSVSRESRSGGAWSNALIEFAFELE